MFNIQHIFRNMPPITKNLLYINVLMYIATMAAGKMLQLNLINILGLFYFESPGFRPWQLITHMFMHSQNSIWHLLFNMLNLIFIGFSLERYLGGKRFFTLYLISGLGGLLFHQAFSFYEVHFQRLPIEYLGPMIGASGAVYGILVALGLFFPNNVVHLYFAIPVKLKYLVLFILAYDLFFGVTGMNVVGGSNIAHFAHIGGAVFAFFVVLYWKKTR